LLQTFKLVLIAEFAAKFLSVENLLEKFAHRNNTPKIQHCNELPVVLFQQMKTA